MKLKVLSLALASSTIISGCVLNDVRDEKICFHDNGEVIECGEPTSEMNPAPVAMDSSSNFGAVQDPTLFNSNVNFVLLSEYVEQMAIQLEQNMSERINKPVAVTSFVPLDSSLKTSSLLGNQISEYFINELKSVGVPVSDYKVTGFIQVTPNGDFALSRKLHELKSDLNIGYVLTGTLIENERGMVINARIVSLETNQVVASSMKLVPNSILQ